MTIRERIMAAARELAAGCPLDRISLAEVARRADVSWPTVRRHVGSKEDLRARLLKECPGLAHGTRDTRACILEAAARVFARHGYNGASVDQVAADAGMTKGAVYWHFNSKSDLFLALLEEDVARMARRLPEAMQHAAGIDDPVEALAVLLRNSLASCRENPDWPTLYLEFSASSRNPEVRKRLHELYRSSQQVACDAVRRMQQAGRLSPELDPATLALLFRTVLNGLMLIWLVYPEQVDPDDVVYELARILWRGVGETGA